MSQKEKQKTIDEFCEIIQHLLRTDLISCSEKVATLRKVLNFIEHAQSEDSVSIPDLEILEELLGTVTSVPDSSTIRKLLVT